MTTITPMSGLGSVQGVGAQVPRRDEKQQRRRDWLYALIAVAVAVLTLGVVGAYQYSQTHEATTTVATSTVPSQFAGVSVPQAMRLSDAAAVSSTYAGVSLPQAMRLSDAAGVPAEYAGVSLPQAMRLSDAAGALER